MGPSQARKAAGTGTGRYGSHSSAESASGQARDTGRRIAHAATTAADMAMGSHHRGGRATSRCEVAEVATAIVPIEIHADAPARAESKSDRNGACPIAFTTACGPGT